MAFDYKSRQYLKVESDNSIRTTQFNEGDIIFHKGESGKTMYEVLSGSVGIYLNYGKENQILLAEKPAGTFFGEIALIEDRPRTASAVALYDKTQLREISVNGFIYYIRQNPDNLKVIMDAMSDRFKEQRKEYFDVCDALADYHRAVENYGFMTVELTQKVEFYTTESDKHRKKLEEEEKKKK